MCTRQMKIPACTIQRRSHSEEKAKGTMATNAANQPCFTGGIDSAQMWSHGVCADYAMRKEGAVRETSPFGDCFETPKRYFGYTLLTVLRGEVMPLKISFAGRREKMNNFAHTVVRLTWMLQRRAWEIRSSAVAAAKSVSTKMSYEDAIGTRTWRADCSLDNRVLCRFVATRVHGTGRRANERRLSSGTRILGDWCASARWQSWRAPQPGSSSDASLLRPHHRTAPGRNPRRFRIELICDPVALPALPQSYLLSRTAQRNSSAARS